MAETDSARHLITHPTTLSVASTLHAALIVCGSVAGQGAATDLLATLEASTGLCFRCFTQKKQPEGCFWFYLVPDADIFGAVLSYSTTHQ